MTCLFVFIFSAGDCLWTVEKVVHRKTDLPTAAMGNVHVGWLLGANFIPVFRADLASTALFDPLRLVRQPTLSRLDVLR